jgi:hypothetical protein
MTAANTRQIGGQHYANGGAFQHWDLVEVFGLGYLEGCATKYLSRWRRKNGVEDLLKADHYVEKLINMATGRWRQPRGEVPASQVAEFCRTYELENRELLCMQILCGSWTIDRLHHVREHIAQLIAEAK